MTMGDDLAMHRGAVRAVLAALRAAGAAVAPEDPVATRGLHGRLADGRGVVVRDERRQRAGSRGGNLCMELLEVPWRDPARGVRPGALLRLPPAAIVVHLHPSGAAAAPAWWWTELARGSLGPLGDVPAFQGWRWGFRGDQRTGAWCFLVPWGRLLLPRDPAGIAVAPEPGGSPEAGARAVLASVRRVAELPASTRTSAERHLSGIHLFSGALRA